MPTPAIWFDDVRQRGAPRVTRWYTKLYLVALGYLTLPILVSAFTNLSGSVAGPWIVLLVTSLLDFWIIFHPWTVGGISLAGYLRGQVGGDKGFDVSEGVDTAAWYLHRAYGTLAVCILAKQIALVILALLPLQGFGLIALIILSLIFLVILGSVYYVEDPWVIRWFWHFYWIIVVVLLAYWIVVWQFPALRHSASRSDVKNAETEVAAQNEEQLKLEVGRIAQKIKAMPKHFTFEQRIAQLSPEERAVWRQAQGGTFAQKSLDAATPVAKKAAKDGSEGAVAMVTAMGNWFADAVMTAFFYERTLDVPIKSLKPTTFCHKSLPKSGRLQFSLPRSLEYYDVIVGGGKSRVATYFRVNNEQSGESFDISDGCVEISFFHPDSRYLENSIEPQLFSVTFESDRIRSFLVLLASLVVLYVAWRILRAVIRRGRKAAAH